MQSSGIHNIAVATGMIPSNQPINQYAADNFGTDTQAYQVPKENS